VLHRSLLRLACAVATATPVVATSARVVVQEPGRDFRRLELSSTFYAEGASFGDLDGDGDADVVSGPYWYEGPEFERRHELEPPVESDPLAYSDDFFTWVLDVDGDGRRDVFKVGFPGKQARWYRNPGEAGGHWPLHLAFEGVANESPALVDIDGDGRVELVCNHGGAFGYAEADWSDPTAPWSFQAISPDLGKGRFTHGLGVGDVDGDDRLDLLEAGGWWRQPAALDEGALWVHHPFPFTTRGGGAQMHAFDVDGDGDADVVTALFAHGWGLSWFEQVAAEEGEVDFVEHRIMDLERGANPWGVRFSSLHAQDVVDVDGDGLLDIVTGKRHWSHGPDGDPKPVGPSVLYWFRLERAEEGARFVPHLIDDDSGVGTQVVAGDVNGDGRTDVVVGNKRGTFVHLQRPDGASVAEPPLHEPEPRAPSPNEREGVRARGADGRLLNLDFETGDLTDWSATGDAFDDQPVEGDSTARRGLDSSDHTGDYWIGGYELHGDGPVGELQSAEFEVTHPWASFLVAGGADWSTRVELVSEGGEVLYGTTGPNYEPLRVAVVDLRDRLGERVRLRLVDENPGGWGHVNFDDFLFHEREPEVDPARRMFERDRRLHAGQPPEEAARNMEVPEGFHVDLVAAEPELHQPIALAIDGRGRLWVAEAHAYPVRVPEEEARDRILVFEDVDGDGDFETRKVFLEGLNLVSGLEVGLGGVWIGAAPHLLFVPDRDDDLVPDGEPEVRLDGWGWEDTHETLNSFAWGPDGWLYGCHGVFTHSRVGRPGTLDAERVPIDAGVWRYHPLRRDFEVFAWGTSNPWGVDFDERGQAFITACVIPHLFHVVQGGRYVRQAGSHFDAHASLELDTIADHLHWRGDSPWSGNLFSGPMGGGHAHCGALLYLGERFPAEYRGRILMHNVHGNRINQDSLERAGSGFVGRHEEDLLLANDAWFRGTDLDLGPDGAVYFLDWSDPRACHWTDSAAWDRSNGRLYRLRYGELPPRTVDPRALGDSELVALLWEGEELLARRARLELQARPDARVRDKLLELLRAGPDVERRLRGLWALAARGEARESDLVGLLDDPEGDLVAWAVQLLAEPRAVSAEVRAELTRLAREHASPVVALYLASALQRIAPDFELAEALLARGELADDPNFPAVLWYGVEAHAAVDPTRCLELARGAELSELGRLLVRRLSAEAATRASVLSALGAAEEREWRDLLLEELAAALRDERHLEPPPGWSELYPRLAADEARAVRDQALWIAMAFDDPAALPGLVELLRDREADLERRLRALEAVASSRSVEASAALRAVLGEASLRGAAIRGLAAAPDEETPPALLELYAELDAEERDDVLATLCGREAFALELLAAIEAGRVPREDLSSFQLRQLRSLGSPTVDATLTRVWGVFREPPEDRAAQIAEWTERYAQEDPARVRPANGRRVFDATCASCHRLFGEGGDLGPDLTGSNRADPEYLWSNVLDPSAVVGRDYLATLVRTTDGLLVTGLVVDEGESSITLANETDEFVVARSEIEERVLSELSIMPEGQGELMSERERRDLAAYLASPEPVQAPVVDPAAVTLFDDATLAGWSGDAAVWSVEAGEIVGRSGGLDRNAFLVSELELGEFRLELDVLLVDDAGNSGVQFWSRPLPGGAVAGYQADVGPGWWGTLYEAQGRGLLAEARAPGAVRPGEWNRYVIEARRERVRSWINGELQVDFEDPEGAGSGRLALQLHSGAPTEVRFRGLELGPPSSEGSSANSR